jgi:hypothetical protein
MKVVISRKSHVVMPSTGEANIVQTLNSPFGNHSKVVTDEEADAYIQLQVERGFKVFVFDYMAAVETQTTTVKVA